MNISVILPAYNAEKFLTRTIQSVLCQTYSDLELIVIDDASTDSTVEIVKTFQGIDQRVRLVMLEHNSGGPAAPRNKGVECSRYDWIAFIDADDFWHPEKLAIQVKYINNNHDVNFLSSGRIFVKTQYFKLFKLDNQISARIVGYKNLLAKNSINLSSVLIKKELLGRFDENEQSPPLDDAKQWLSVTSKGTECHLLNVPLYFYLNRRDSLSGNKWNMFIKRRRMLKEHVNCDQKKLSNILIYYLLFQYFFKSIFERLFRNKL